MAMILTDRQVGDISRRHASPDALARAVEREVILRIADMAEHTPITDSARILLFELARDLRTLTQGLNDDGEAAGAAGRTGGSGGKSCKNIV